MSASKRFTRRTAALLCATVLALTACAGQPEGDSGESAKSGPNLVIYAGASTPVVANFNPYSPTLLSGTYGMIYEPLYYYNKATPTDPEPLLATGADWSEDGLSATITIRSGVKWNDGQPLTADDVAYSFTNDAVKPDYIKDATVVDPETVTLNFTEPAFTNKYALLGATLIVPKHVFEKQKDLVSFANATAPVGTGPFMLDTATDAAYTMKKNPNYWDAGKPTIDKVQYLGVGANSSAESLMQAGQIDFMTVFVPDPTTLTDGGQVGYLQESSSNPVVIMTCSNSDLGCKGAQTDKAVRKAFSLSLDRGVINDKAYAGIAVPASPTYAKPGRDDEWISDGNKKEVPLEADVDAAKKVLEDAGYALGSDGIYAKGDQRASFTLLSVEGWSDANAAAELAVSQAKAAGIEVKQETVTQDQATDRRLVGDYEMIYWALFGTPIADPYTIYRNSFTTSYTQPAGTALETGQTNFARYSNPEVDAAVTAAAQTDDAAIKKQQYAIVQKNVSEDVPYIPMFHTGVQSFFNETAFTGWPSDSDLYALPVSYDGISVARVLKNLSYK